MARKFKTSYADDPIAEDSEKTMREKKKLLSRFQKVDKQITKEALEMTSTKIKERITRMSQERSVLKDGFGVFDGNKNSKGNSETVQKFAKSLKSMLEDYEEKVKSHKIDE